MRISGMASVHSIIHVPIYLLPNYKHLILLVEADASSSRCMTHTHKYTLTHIRIPKHIYKNVDYCIVMVDVLRIFVLFVDPSLRDTFICGTIYRIIYRISENIIHDYNKVRPYIRFGVIFAVFI